jgi:hypothetical protein
MAKPLPLEAKATILLFGSKPLSYKRPSNPLLRNYKGIIITDKNSDSVKEIQ